MTYPEFFHFSVLPAHQGSQLCEGAQEMTDWYINQLSCFWDKLSDTCSLKGGEIYLARSFRKFSSWSADSKAKILRQNGMVEQNCLGNGSQGAEQGNMTERKR